MSAAPVIIIITRPKKAHQNLADHEQVQVLADADDTTADILRKAADQVEAEE